MSDFSWLTDLFAAAATMQSTITAPAFVSANVSLVTNEMGGNVMVGGTVTQAAGSVVYVPTAGGAGKPKLMSKAMGTTTFFNSLFRLKDGRVIDQVVLSITMPSSPTSAPVVKVSYLDIFGNPTIGAQTLSGVGSGARVLYGVAGDGIATPASPQGTSALFAIAPFNLGVQAGT